MTDAPEPEPEAAEPVTQPMPEPVAEPGSRRGLPEWAEYSLQIFGLAGVAVAQPLFALLGENPTYFVAHRASTLDIVLFALVVIVVPAVVVAVPVLVARAVSPRVGMIAAAVAVGLLFTIAVLGAFDLQSMSAGVFVAALVIGTAAVGYCYVRWRGLRLFATYLSPAPLLFAALFIFTSGVQPLVFANGDPAVLTASPGRTPVVVLLFDELPLGALLRPDGTIDGDRFPGFQELSEISTWYPRATTVATYTFIAVPAFLTGRLPNPAVPPAAGQYPRSLFTMLGGSHELHVGERVTTLCSRSLCGEDETDDEARQSLVRDTAIVASRELLPTSIADRWFPSVSGSWTDFGGGLAEQPLPDDDVDLGFEEFRERREEREKVGYADFLSSLTNAEVGLWYQHEMLPHMHYGFVPDGRTYQASAPRSWNSEAWWVDSDLATVNAQQRLMLQLEYTDTRLTALLDRLREQRMLDDVLLVVASDHGIDFTPGRSTRGQLAEGDDAQPTDAVDLHDAVLPIPLFVKYPGQTDGAVDDRAAHSIDVLPTIADALDVGLPEDWEFEGTSLLDEPPDPATPGQWVHGDHVEDVAEYPDPLPMAEQLNRLFGEHRRDHDVYAFGPFADLVGTQVADVGEEMADAAVSVTGVDDWTDVDLESNFVPALLAGDVTGIEPGQWIAVAVNGVVAGLGPVYEDFDGDEVVEAMLDPSLMVDGRNELSLFAVSGETGELRPVPLG